MTGGRGAHGLAYIRLVYYMDFEWDTDESTRNAHTRNFDFAFARLVFEGPCLVREDRRRDYGERRMVSARRSNRRERQAYAEDPRG